jgi:A/G-specific adenine glycosylase
MPRPDAASPFASAADLLAWYDRQRRDLPWRAKPGERPDPYRVWLSEIMLQQTTVTAVKPYFAAFLARFPDVAALAAAPSEAVMAAWAGLGYYSRARNLHACARLVVDQHGGRFPDTEDALRALPGIGPYTAGAVAAIAFNRKAAAVDGNVERVFTRLHAIADPLPGARQLVRETVLAVTPDDRPGDFVQAVFDLGATICTPKTPACALCPWSGPCAARKAGLQGGYPVKQKKAAGAVRRGAAFVALRADGAVLLRTRPAKGLLGGMAETPTTEWSANFDGADIGRDAPFKASWRTANQPVRHVFTHFPLELTVLATRLPKGSDAPEGMRFTPLTRLDDEPLSTVMRKVIERGLALLGEAA